MTRKYILFLLIIASSVVCFGQDFQSRVDSFCRVKSLQNANISILFRDMTSGDVVASYRPKAVVPTASTIKVLTTATLLEKTGPDFRFSTFLETDGVIENGVLRGNLYIRGTGDPTLGSDVVGNPDFFPSWVKAIKDAGISRIAGRVIADVSFYDPAEAVPYGWVHEDIGNFYSGGVFPLCFKDNIMTIFLNSGSAGSKAEVLSTDPYIPDLELENYFVCGTGRDWLVSGVPYSNHRVLSGCIVPNKGRWSVKAAIPNPPLLLAQSLTAALFANGIKTDSGAIYTKMPQNAARQVIYTHQSPALIEILTETNQQSNNMYAEQVFRYLGSMVRTPVLISDCVDFEKSFWQQRAIDLYGAYIYDGSGLSPQDVLSADMLVGILTYMGKHSAYRDAWISTLPVSGQSGTLKGFLGGTGLEGRVVAKSGTTSRVKAYAGYVNAKDGHTYAFAIMVNNASVKSRVVQREISRLLQDMFE